MPHKRTAIQVNQTASLSKPENVFALPHRIGVTSPIMEAYRTTA